jgi:hypothetical protein
MRRGDGRESNIGDTLFQAMSPFGDGVEKGLVMSAAL